MKISESLEKKMTFSFEVFPPKDDGNMGPLLETLDNLYKYNPDFISVTYGAGGTNVGRIKETCSAIIDSGHTVISHYNCIGHSLEKVDSDLKEFRDLGIENILALRGDFLSGQNHTQGYFHHGDRLINHIKEDFPEFCIGGACYPEKHIEAESFDSDIAHLRSKQDNGAEFLMTQLCYDLDAHERFIERIRVAGITLPVIVGIMPVLVKDSLLRMTLSNGCSIPRELSEIVGKYGDDKEEFKKAGKEYTLDLIYKYMNKGIFGLHLYSLNKYKDLAEIINDSGIRGIF